jgi:hypothetical protein
MKKICITAIAVGCLHICMTSQTNNEFHESYRLSSTLWERSEGIHILQNGRILDIGESSHCTGVTTCYNSCSLIWFDQQGTMIRNRKIGSSVGFYGVEAEECNDHSLIVHGNITNNALFMKTDSIGTVQWSKVVDHASDMAGNRDLVKMDTTYFICGSLGYDGSQIYSFTESGNFRWLKSFTSADRFQLNAITKTNTNTMMGMAQVTNTSNYYGAACFVEIDMNGNILNSKLITPAFTYYGRIPAFNICRSSDGNFIGTCAFTNGNQYVIKIDPSMNILWSANITANPAFGSGYRDEITADNDGGVWIGSHSQYSVHIQLIHIGNNGSLLEKNIFSNHDLIELTALDYTSDCNLLVSGARRDGVTYSHYLAALGADGKTTCLDSLYNVTVSSATLGTQTYNVSTTTEVVNVTPLTMFQEAGVYQEVNYCSTTADLCAINAIDGEDEQNVWVYPVPVSDELNIAQENIQSLQFTLYTVTGQEMHQQLLMGNLNAIDMSKYNNGVYIYELRSNNRLIKRGRLIKV